MTLVEPLITSEKVFHIDMPAVSHTTKGMSPFGADLKPRLKTSQKMNMVIKGLMNVQKNPSIDPTILVEMSLLAISIIKNLRWTSVRRKLMKP
jgi:hypothetical protein